MNENSDPKIKKILERIRRSGFPLEIEIGNSLRKNNWMVVNQWPYIDKITKKVRTADVFAWKIWLQAGLSFLLLIECKRSPGKEWVFYGQKKEEDISAELSAFIELVSKLGNTPLESKLTTKLATMSYDDIRKSEFSSLTMLDKSIKIGVLNMGAGKQDFHVATQQIMSATEVAKEGMKLCCVYPAIVFDGELFEFYQENGADKIRPINHLQYRSFWQKEMLIDVVRKEYFNEFMGRIEKDSLILSKILKNEGVKP